MYYNTLYLRNSSDEILVLGHTEIAEITESFACGEKMSHRLHRFWVAHHSAANGASGGTSIGQQRTLFRH